MSAPTEAQLLRLLGQRYQAPEWAFLQHVADATGWKKGRTLDAVAMSLWPSRGLELHGFEVKVSRGDWLRELRKPDKADGWALRCHRFWLVAPAEVVLPIEIPALWGLIEQKGRKLQMVREAPARPVEPLSWERMAALLRGVQQAQSGMVPRVDIADELEAAREKATERALEEARRGASTAEKDLAALRKNVEAFEAASGVEIERWKGGDIGQAVRVVLDEGTASERAKHQMTYARNAAADALRTIDEALVRMGAVAEAAPARKR